MSDTTLIQRLRAWTPDVVHEPFGLLNSAATSLEQQAAQIAEKDAEIARLISTKEHIRKEINAMIGRVEDDAVLIEALRADAERYRWLRNSASAWYVGPSYSTYNDIVVDGEYADYSGTGKDLDAAIDAALRQEQPT